MEGNITIDYTKYKLKPVEEIKKLVEGLITIQILICEKCYKEFSSDIKPECQKIRNILESCGVTLVKCVAVPFLCNNYLTKEILSNIDPDIPIGVVACGIGIQFVSGRFSNRKVLTLTNTVSHSDNLTSIRGSHGISLGKELCASCGQCYLGSTGGICPVIDCAKSLLNGPCGGTDKNGMCEVDPTKKCAWVEIYERLQKQKRTISNVPETRDYNIFPYDEEAKISINNKNRRNEGFYGGLYPEDNKASISQIPIRTFPPPEKLYIFLSQHIGLPAKPIVNEGEKIKKGQKIGESTGFISSHIHSGVSGKVLSITEKRHPITNKKEIALVVENDGLETLDDSVYPLENWESLGKEEIITFLLDKGLVGLGGAMFPSVAKLSPPKPVDTLIINGSECEPHLSGDNRLMCEYPEDILKGVSVIEKILDVKRTFFCVEDNKEEAYQNIKKCSTPSVNILKLKTKYPQGAERMLIRRSINRTVPPDGLPFDVGVVVFNVATAYSIYKAVYEGLPLIERVVTVDGEGVSGKGNFLMKVGTPLEDIARVCFSDSFDLSNYEVKMGGPMMGVLQEDLNSYIVKGTTGIISNKRSPVDVSTERVCIKCGRCVDVCPMELYPHYFAFYGKKGLWNKCVEYEVKNCIECGCCQYICASKIDILSLIKKAKLYVDNKT
ncbi:electron transport complex subunit RsxC [bacterium]|nr:electron transport complex subunit RsxC [bacterium]